MSKLWSYTNNIIIIIMIIIIIIINKIKDNTRKIKCNQTLGNAFTNKKVFNFFLKMSTEAEDLRSRGRAFQREGATNWNARSPLVLRFVLGTVSRP